MDREIWRGGKAGGEAAEDIGEFEGITNKILHKMIKASRRDENPLRGQTEEATMLQFHSGVLGFPHHKFD